MIRRLRKILADKKGMSNTVSVLWAILIFSFVMSLFIGVGQQLHVIFTLDQFANELVAKASIEGRCSGSALNERYNQLCKSTGLKPKVTYTANYWSKPKKLVQYGDEITVTLDLESRLVAWGNRGIDIPYKVKATSQSMEYWKE